MAVFEVNKRLLVRFVSYWLWNALEASKGRCQCVHSHYKITSHLGYYNGLIHLVHYTEC